jgi:protein-L-isoaspartate(D-aspartate) O-methyltransferase
MPGMPDREEARRRMVAEQVVARGVADPRVLSAMRAVPREAFVPAAYAERAYEDSPVPIGEGQTISQPYVVGLMLEAARLTPEDTLLEVGSGSGYAAAVASRICRRVFAMERHAILADGAAGRWKALGYDNITQRVGDGTLGWPEQAPFDAILVSAGGPSVPHALTAQLAVGGRLVIPVGGRAQQTLARVTRTGEKTFEQEDLGDVMFVPLVGEQGWR